MEPAGASTRAFSQGQLSLNADPRSLALKLALLRRRRRLSPVPFKEQDAFVEDPAQSIAAICTRRAGKSNALARRFKRAMDKYPGSMCIYIALTRESAKNTMWPVLQEQSEKEGWGLEFIESSLTVRDPKTGSSLKLFGADMQNFIRRLRGIKTPGAAVDEAQEFGTHIEDLINNILTPATADYTDGWIALTGTPGAIPRGYFFDVTQEGKYGFSVHRWSLEQNPFMPDPTGFIEKLKAKMGWDDQNPTLLREYRGRWVLDYDSLLIQYNGDRDHFDSLPKGNWHHIMGVDIGFNDADAIAILAWSDSSPNIYLVEEELVREQDITSLSQAIERLSRKYNPDKIVMDEGGLGKKVAEEIRRRKHLPIHPADKVRKMENVAFLNDYMRQGKFKAKRTSQFATDSELVQIDWEKSTPDKIVLKKNYHSDAIDAVLYAFKESPAFTFEASKDKPKLHSHEWFEQEVEEMEQAAEERMERESSEYDEWSDW